ncbi:MAG: siroheme synthase CysG [Pseudomonadota bacterium]
MFLRMEDRRVVIVGGGEQAAQKCRLLLKTEAQIDIVSHTLDPELAGVVAKGRARHIDGPLRPSLLKDAALVFVATGCPGADAGSHALARDAGALVNVVDQPDLCEAITPSIVDRDPVVVAIGTEGTAPVLARQIKTRIEYLLEPSIGELAALAGRLRQAVAARVPPRDRRAFWRWVFADAPRQAAARNDLSASAELMKSAIEAGEAPGAAKTGRIALVGAGPGAADLLTLRAVQRLQEADVIFYDRLVDPRVLELARRDAERIYVGKAVGACAWPQDRIDAVVVAAAQRGQSVVRLKSGDPTIFGRADEEVAAARRAGVDIEIVPGITAATAAAAGAGRSLTRRGETDRVVLATGTSRDGDPAPSFRETLRPGTTLALYMATKAGARIRDELLAAGIPGDTEVEVVANASKDGEQRVRGDLSDFCDRMKDARISHPAVILIRRKKTCASVESIAPRQLAVSAASL